MRISLSLSRSLCVLVWQKINSTQSRMKCVAVVLEYQTTTVALLLFVTFGLTHSPKWIALVCVGSGFFSSSSLSGFYDTIDIKAIKFVRWDKYCEAFGRIACYIAIIMCAYVNIANTKRTESMVFFLFFAAVRPLRWVQSSQHDVAWIRMMAPTCRQPGMKSRMRQWNGGKTNYAPSTRVDWIAFEWI